MSFLYPLGLLGLIGVPILIIIYIIKNKYTEQVVSATYLWILSEKFLKRRNPIKMITGIISLILQILAVIAVSFAIAQPVITLADSADDICYILDASGSMRISEGEKTRWELGVDYITESINGAVKGSAFTLVYVGETTESIFESLDNKEQALSLLNDLQPSYSAPDFNGALSVAQAYFNENTSVDVKLITDKSYEESENVEIINLSSGVDNYALTNADYNISVGVVNVSCDVISYESDASLTVELYVDDGESPADTVTVSVEKMQTGSVSLSTNATSFRSLRLSLANEDALGLDNEVVIYSVSYENTYDTLLISDSPFFMQAVLNAVGYTQIRTVSTDKYTSTSGYGLYIFDNFVPDAMPTDGAVWFINPYENITNAGFSVQSEETLPTGGKMEYTTSSASLVKTLLEGIDRQSSNEIYLSRYIKCGQNRIFTNLMYYNGNPLLFAGTNTYGNREVVFAFDVQFSDLAVQPDFVILMKNLLDYTFPEVLDTVLYYCGDTMEINAVANCDSIRVDSPQGTITYLDTTTGVGSYRLAEVGIHTITMTVGKTVRTFYVYSSLPEEERFTIVNEQAFSIYGEAGSAKRDGIYDDLLALFIVLGVIVLADWAVYCYEQYQLR